jgi:hypothetical protein
VLLKRRDSFSSSKRSHNLKLKGTLLHRNKKHNPHDQLPREWSLLTLTCWPSISSPQLNVSKGVAEPLGIQLSQIILIRLPDHLPLELKGSSDEARLGGPWLWYQLDFGWDLKPLKSSLLCSLSGKCISAQTTYDLSCPTCL